MTTDVKLALYDQLNQRSRWYSQTLWQIPFTYIAMCGVVLSLSKDSTNPSLLLACGIFGLFVAVHCQELYRGEQKAVHYLIEIEKDIMEKAIGADQSYTQRKARFFKHSLLYMQAIAALAFLVLGFFSL